MLTLNTFSRVSSPFPCALCLALLGNIPQTALPSSSHTSKTHFSPAVFLVGTEAAAGLPLADSPSPQRASHSSEMRRWWFLHHFAGSPPHGSDEIQRTSVPAGIHQMQPDCTQTNPCGIPTPVQGCHSGAGVSTSRRILQHKGLQQSQCVHTRTISISFPGWENFGKLLGDFSSCCLRPASFLADCGVPGTKTSSFPARTACPPHPSAISQGLSCPSLHCCITPRQHRVSLPPALHFAVQGTLLLHSNHLYLPQFPPK